MRVVVLAEDERGEVPVLGDDGKRVELMLPDDVVCLRERDAVLARDETLARRHELGDLGGRIHAARTVVAARHDAEQLARGGAVLGDGHGGVTRLALELDDVLHGHVRRNVRVARDEAGLVGLDLADHLGLGLGRLRAVDERATALAGKGLGHARTGNGLHDGRHHRNVERKWALLAALVLDERRAQADV